LPQGFQLLVLFVEVAVQGIELGDDRRFLFADIPDALLLFLDLLLDPPQLLFTLIHPPGEAGRIALGPETAGQEEGTDERHPSPNAQSRRNLPTET
jgi:hypothetical protein